MFIVHSKRGVILNHLEVNNLQTVGCETTNNLLIQNMYPNTSHQDNKMRAIYRGKFTNLRCWICRVDTSDDRAATDQHICYETHEGRVELLISSKIITTECL